MQSRIAFLTACIFTLSGIYTDASAYNPFSSAREIRTARQAGSDTVLRLNYEYTSGTSPVEKKTILIGPDFASVSDERATAIYDFRLRRIFRVNLEQKVFFDQSLNSLIAFRYQEFNNRMALLKAVSATGKQPPESMQPFAMESALGLINQNFPRPAFEASPLSPHGTSYKLNGEEWLRVIPAKADASQGELRLFDHLLRYMTTIHPDLETKLEAAPAIPETLAFQSIKGAQGEHVTETYHLISADHASVDYPLPADYRPAIANGEKTGTLFDNVGPIMIAALNGKQTPGPRSADDYRKAINQAVAKGPDLSTALLYIAFTLHSGAQAANCDPADKNCISAADIFQRASANDSRMALLTRSLKVQNQNPTEALDLWGMILENKPEYGYVLDIFMANILSQRKQYAEADTHFQNALKGNPYISGFYKDIGDHMMRQYRAELAWACFDAGRSLPNTPESDSLKAIDQFEEHLASQNPQFY